jgi:nucleoside 2-deoxyribosyltransferase
MRKWVDLVTFALESRGFIVFSPYRDVGVLGASNDTTERRKYFVADLEGIDNANFVIALLDGLGRGGTSWELGYAYRAGIPILGLLTHTSRQLSNMVEESCDVIVSSIPALLNEVYTRASIEY